MPLPDNHVLSMVEEGASAFRRGRGKQRNSIEQGHRLDESYNAAGLTLGS